MFAGGRKKSTNKERVKRLQKEKEKSEQGGDAFIEQEFKRYDCHGKSVEDLDGKLTVLAEEIEKSAIDGKGVTRKAKITQKRLRDCLHQKVKYSAADNGTRQHKLKQAHGYYQANRQYKLQKAKAGYQANRQCKLQMAKAGYQANRQCKLQMAKAAYQANRRHKLQMATASFQANREHRLQQFKTDYRANKQDRLQMAKAGYQANKEHRLQQFTIDYQTNKQDRLQMAKAGYQANKEHRLQQFTIDYQTNKQDRLQMAKAGYQANKGHRLQQFKIDYQTNKQDRLQMAKAGYQANKEHRLQMAKAGYQANKEHRLQQFKIDYQANKQDRLEQFKDYYAKKQLEMKLAKKILHRAKQSLKKVAVPGDKAMLNAVTDYIGMLPVNNALKIPTVPRDSNEFKAMVRMKFYAQMKKKFCMNAERLEGDDLSELCVDFKLQKLLAVKREAQQLLHNRVNTIEKKWSVCEKILHDMMKNKDDVEKTLSKLYGVKKYHSKTQEQFGSQVTEKQYVFDFEMFPKITQSQEEVDKCEEAVVADVCDNLLDSVVELQGESLQRESNSSVKSKHAKVRLCEEGCDGEIPNDWATKLHAVLGELRNEGKSIQKLQDVVRELETCGGCGVLGECTLKENCLDVVKFLRKLAPHFVGIRTLLRQYYKVREVTIYIYKIDKCLRFGDWNMLGKLISAYAVDVPEAVSECLCAEEDSSAFQKRNEIHSDERVIECWGAALEHLNHEAANFPKQICALCERYRKRNQMKKKPFQTFGDLKMAIVANRDKASKKDGQKKKHCKMQRISGPDHFPIVDELISKGACEPLELCQECWASVAADKIPKLSRMNLIAVDVIPPEILVLNAFEFMLIQKVRPLMTVLKLKPLSGSPNLGTLASAVTGSAIHMPLPMAENLEYALSQLPDPKQLAIILQQVPTKQKVAWQSFVDLDRVLAALKWLVENNEHYKGTEILSKDELSKKMNEIVIEVEEQEEDDNPAGIKVPPEPSLEHVTGKVNIENVTVQYMQKDVPNKTKFYEQFNCKRLVGEIVSAKHKLLEVLAFPHLFPRGCFTKSDEREVSVRTDTYIRYLLTNKDSRWRRNEMYLFDAYHRWVDRSVDGNIFVMRNCGVFKDMSATELLSRAKGQDEDLYIHAAQVTAATKGYPEYWARKRSDLHAYDEQFGPATFFLTWSWKDYALQHVRDELLFMNRDIADVEKLSNSALIKIDPVTNQFAFQRHLDAMMNLLVPDGGVAGPLGLVEHHYGRIEFQARGAPHVHMKLWIKDAPVYGKNSEDELLTFLEDKITCGLPDKVKSPLLYKLVIENQRHTCNVVSCHKKVGKNVRKSNRCRFGFPRAPCENAKILPLQEVLESRARGRHIKKLHCCQRSSSEVNVNDYNPALLMAIGGNMDIQFVGEESEAINRYISNYVSKGERGGVQDAFEKLDNNKSVHSRLKKLAIQLSHDRQVSIQEAVAIVVGMPLTFSDTAIEWLGVGLKSERCRKRKSLEELEALAKVDSSDIFSNNLVDVYYPSRPESMENVSLLAAASQFTVVKTEPKKAKFEHFEFKVPSGETYQFRQRKPVVIKTRFCRTDTTAGQERLCQKLLMLHVPWRNEDELLAGYSTYSQAFVAKCGDICELQQNLNRRKNLEDSLEQARMWVAKAEEEDRLEEMQQIEMPAPIDRVNAKSAELMSHFGKNEADSTDQLELLKQNPEQWRVFTTIEEQISHQEMHKKGKCECGVEPPPIRLHVGGKAGTGKSFLINSIVASISDKYKNSEDARPLVAVCAPTGLAAYNINGVTLHKMFELPTQHTQTGEGVLKKWDDATIKIYRKVLEEVKLFIVDEISMVSSTVLAMVHHRLNSLWPKSITEMDDKTRLLGGANVMICGDLLQLPPVNAPYPFECKTGFGVPPVPDLWQHFDYVELVNIMRQKDCVEFAEMLNRIRIGSPTLKDIQILESRIVPSNSLPDLVKLFAKHRDENRTSSVCLFSTHDEVDAFNTAMLEFDGVKCFKVHFEETTHGNMRKYAKCKSKQAKGKWKTKKSRKKASETAGLADEVTVGVGARVMLQRNLDSDKGLVNGALGYINSVNTGGSKVVDVDVKFDHMENIQTIGKISCDYEKSPTVYVTRTQLPLNVAYGMTIHKAQGLSLDSVMVDLGGTFSTNGMTYVALSRVKTLEGLHIIRLNVNHIRAEKRCILEYNRLRASDKVGGLGPIQAFNCLPDGYESLADAMKKKKYSVAFQTPDPTEAAVGVNLKVLQTDVYVPTKPVIMRTALQFTNRLGESCYCNALVQGLLRAPELTVALDGRRKRTLLNDKNVVTEWRKLVKMSKDHSILTANTDAFRSSVGDNYKPGTGQKTLLFFFFDLIEKLPSWRKLFLVNMVTERKCFLCEQQHPLQMESNVLYTIARGEKGSVGTIAEALNGTRAVPSTGMCPQCSCTISVQSSRLRLTADTRYVFLLLIPTLSELPNPEYRFEGVIENFSPDNIHVQDGDVHLQTIAAITHTGVSRECGHHFAYASADNQLWHKLDCLQSSVEVVHSLPAGLKDVYMLLLKRI